MPTSAMRPSAGAPGFSPCWPTPRRVGADVGHRLALGILVPGPVLHRPEGLPRRTGGSDPRPGGRGGPLDGGLADGYAGQAGQGLLGGQGVTGLHARQTDGLVGGGVQVVFAQAQLSVEGGTAARAVVAVVVVSGQAQGAE